MPSNSSITERMVSDYCRKRIAPYLQPVHSEAIRKFLIGSVKDGAAVPRHAGKYDWQTIAAVTNVPRDMLAEAGRHIVPLLDPIGRSARNTARRTEAPDRASNEPLREKKDPVRPRTLNVTTRADQVLSGAHVQEPKAEEHPTASTERRYHRRPVVEFPEPLWTDWEDVDGFADALNLHIKRHGDSVRHLFHAVARDDRATNHRTLMKWASGELAVLASLAQKQAKLASKQVIRTETSDLWPSSRRIRSGQAQRISDGQARPHPSCACACYLVQ